MDVRYLNHQWYIRSDLLVSIGVNENTLKSAKYRESSKWDILNDPHDERCTIVALNSLDAQISTTLRNRLGMKEEHWLYHSMLRAMYVLDADAEKYYMSYTTALGTALPSAKVRYYTIQASWIGVFERCLSDKKLLKKSFGGGEKKTSKGEENHPFPSLKKGGELKGMDLFWQVVYTLIEVEQIGLPTSYKRLKGRLKEYSEQGYRSLIDWRTGTRLAAKIDDEVSKALLLEMICHHNHVDDVWIMCHYNEWAVKNNYKPITAGTVSNYRHKHALEVAMARQGNNALLDKYLKQVKGFRPSFPLAMVEHDDNHIDYWYVDVETKNNYTRYKAIVVLDSHNDYVLGYAYALEITADLIKAAYLNAMYHIKELTGDWYTFHELKCDRWNSKALQPYYQSLGRYIQTPVGSKHRGYIEPFFGSILWKRCIKTATVETLHKETLEGFKTLQGVSNYTGNNITAKHRGVNMEVVKQSKAIRPTVQQGIQQLETFFNLLRTMPNRHGVNKQAEWLKAWNNCPTENKILLTWEQVIKRFGVEHNHRGEGISITNRGVEPVLMGTKRSYDLPADIIARCIGLKVVVYYDPYDVNTVLVETMHKLVDDKEPHEGFKTLQGVELRIMATESVLQPRALIDATANSRTYLNAVLDSRMEVVETYSRASEERKALLKRHQIEATDILLEGVTSKELMQEATDRYLSGDDDVWNSI